MKAIFWFTSALLQQDLKLSKTRLQDSGLRNIIFIQLKHYSSLKLFSVKLV